MLVYALKQGSKVQSEIWVLPGHTLQLLQFLFTNCTSNKLPLFTTCHDYYCKTLSSPIKCKLLWFLLEALLCSLPPDIFYLIHKYSPDHPCHSFIALIMSDLLLFFRDIPFMWNSLLGTLATPQNSLIHFFKHCPLFFLSTVIHPFYYSETASPHFWPMQLPNLLYLVFLKKKKKRKKKKKELGIAYNDVLRS